MEDSRFTNRPGLTTVLPLLFLTAIGFANEPPIPASHIDTAEQARASFERGDYREAERIYEIMLRELPNNLYVLSNLGVVRFRAGKLKQSEEALQRAITVAPTDDFSHCTLGIVYYSQGRYDDAVIALTKALAINQKNGTAHRYLGIVAAQKDWHDAAIKEFDTAETLDPSLKINTNVGDFLTPLEKSRLKLPGIKK